VSADDRQRGEAAHGLHTIECPHNAPARSLSVRTIYESEILTVSCEVDARS
jgi:hypothetical protein